MVGEHVDGPFGRAHWLTRTVAEANVSTGHLPGDSLVETLLVEAYDRYRAIDAGVVAGYIPALARVSPNGSRPGRVGLGSEPLAGEHFPRLRC